MNDAIDIKYVQIKIYTKAKQFFRKTREKLQKNRSNFPAR